jgi:hypothetical protein
MVCIYCDGGMSIFSCGDVYILCVGVGSILCDGDGCIVCCRLNSATQICGARSSGCKVEGWKCMLSPVYGVAGYT